MRARPTRRVPSVKEGWYQWVPSWSGAATAIGVTLALVAVITGSTITVAWWTQSLWYAPNPRAMRVLATTELTWGDLREWPKWGRSSGGESQETVCIEMIDYTNTRLVASRPHDDATRWCLAWELATELATRLSNQRGLKRPCYKEGQWRTDRTCHPKAFKIAARGEEGTFTIVRSVEDARVKGLTIDDALDCRMVIAVGHPGTEKPASVIQMQAPVRLGSAVREADLAALCHRASTIEEYADWRSESEGLTPCYGDGSAELANCEGYRLPTQSEWIEAMLGERFREATWQFDENRAVERESVCGTDYETPICDYTRTGERTADLLGTGHRGLVYGLRERVHADGFAKGEDGAWLYMDLGWANVEPLAWRAFRPKPEAMREKEAFPDDLDELPDAQRGYRLLLPAPPEGFQTWVQRMLREDKRKERW